MNEGPTVGILTYGSLIGDPGPEIEEVRTRTIEGLTTPFSVEFARMSGKTRGGAVSEKGDQRHSATTIKDSDLLILPRQPLSYSPPGPPRGSNSSASRAGQ
jgi:hypothetical protein